MRVFSGVVAGFVLVGSLTGVARADGAGTALDQPVGAVDVASVPVPAVDEPAVDDGAPADVVAELPARRTDDFGLVGVTWQRGFDENGLEVEVRLRSAGAWAPWEELHVERAAGEGGRGGTEPLWVGEADGVAVRVTSPTGERPAGLAVSTIDAAAGTTSAATSAATSTTTTSAAAVTQAADGSPTYTPKPSIITRSAWKAKKNTYCDSPRTGDETRGVVVHHTAGSNDYSRSESAAIIRAVQAYHMDARDWCDIGYNFLVDRFGRIFEGRNGGVDRAVRGAHAGYTSVNTYTMGVAMLGSFDSKEPTGATKSAMVELIGWRLGTTFHPATGTYTIGKRRLDRINGHRDVYATACPGEAAYEWIGANGGLRERVGDYIAGYTSDIKSRYRTLGKGTTGPVSIGEYPFSTGEGGRKARFGRLDMYASPAGTFTIGNHFRTEYAVMGEQSGRLGVPTSGSQATSRSTVRVQRFADGSIYRVTRSTTKAYALFGSIDAKYRALGQEKSALGAPTRRQVKISGNRYRAWFAHGHLTRQSGGSVTVSLS